MKNKKPAPKKKIKPVIVKAKKKRVYKSQKSKNKKPLPENEIIDNYAGLSPVAQMFYRIWEKNYDMHEGVKRR